MIMPQTKEKIKVFISYNHQDQSYAKAVKTQLNTAGYDVHIDFVEMYGGEDISSFIHRSISDTNITLLLVSENSLKSNWVGLETITTFYKEKIDIENRFLACKVDGYTDKQDWINDLTDTLKMKLTEKQKERTKREKNNLGTADIDSVIIRLRDLLHFSDRIKARLEGSRVIDLVGGNVVNNIEEVTRALDNIKKHLA
jgi:hypothetical protein